MHKKLCIILIINTLMVSDQLIANSYMHNRCGVVPRFSDLEVVALNMASESIGIDSESLLFVKLREYKSEIPHLISRR